jgi:hypothetical protein
MDFDFLEAVKEGLYSGHCYRYLQTDKGLSKARRRRRVIRHYRKLSGN